MKVVLITWIANYLGKDHKNYATKKYIAYLWKLRKVVGRNSALKTRIHKMDLSVTPYNTEVYHCSVRVLGRDKLK